MAARRHTHLKRTVLAGAIALAIGGGYTPAATAQPPTCPTTIASARTTACSLAGTQATTVTGTGSIVITDDSPAIEVLDNGPVSIVNQAGGLISVSVDGSSNATAIYFDSGLTGTLTNAGTIRTTVVSGDSYATAYAIYISGDLAGTLTNTGTINATASEATSSDALAYGIYVSGDVTGTLTNSGTINATAFDAYEDATAYGIYVSGELAAGGSISNSGTINATARDASSVFAYGIYISGDLDGTLTNSGTINATASDATASFATAYGIYISGDLTGTLTNSGTINATATSVVDDGGSAYAYGIYISGDLASPLSLTNSGTINARGSDTDDSVYAYGIYIGVDLAGTLTNSGTINATAIGTYSSAQAYGVYISDSLTGTLTNSGTINATASNSSSEPQAFGIYIGSDLDGILTNSGTINATVFQYGDYDPPYAYGIYISSDLDGTLTNSGTINASTFVFSDVSGYAYGIYVDGSVSSPLSLTNSGSISALTVGTTSTAYAYGIYIGDGVEGTLTNSGTINARTSSPAGDSLAVGIYVDTLGEEATFTNSGTIRARATGAGEAFSVFIDGGTGTFSNLAGGLLDAPGFEFGGSVDFINSGTVFMSQESSVGGDFTQTGSGKLVSFVNSNTADDAGFVNVDGDASLAPSSTVHLATGLIGISAGQTYTVLDADAGDAANLGAGVLPTITGTAIYSYAATTDNTDIVITVTPSATFANALAGSPNATSLFNSASLAPLFAADEELGTEFSLISDPAEYIAALESLVPDSSGALLSGSLSLQNQATDTVNDRLDSLRTAAAADGRMTGMAAGDTTIGGGAAMWAQGFGAIADQDNRGGFNGYDADTHGVAIGADTLVTRNLRVGAALALSKANVDTKNVDNDMDIHGQQLSLYAGHETDTWFFDAVASYAWNNYNSTRFVSAGAITRRARADFDGDQWGIRGRVGRTWKYQGVNVTPYVSLHYTHLELDGYTESGAGATNLTVAGQDYDFLESGLGVSVSKRFETSGVAYVLEGHLAWLHEWEDDNQANTSTFAAGGPSFQTSGLDPADNSLNAGASLGIFASDNVDVRAAYDFKYAADYSSHAAQVVVRYRF